LALDGSVSALRVGVVFPGQGSQTVGMASGLAEAFPSAATLLRRANKVLGFDLTGLMALGPEEMLCSTRYSQPAIFVTNLALAMAVGPVLEPVVSAGHSFGELCSLTISGALTFDDALHLVDERGKAMEAASALVPGAMAAILGLNPELLGSVVEEARSFGRIRMANFNAPGQIVVSGDEAAVKQASTLALAVGAKRAVRLNVSGAWHSELMEPARKDFDAIVDAAPIRPPRFPVISNVDARVCDDVATIKQNLKRSLTDEVRWHETALRLLDEHLDLLVEFGASPVLTSLCKRLPGAPKTIHVGDVAGVVGLQRLLSESTTEVHER
jgi:[acyl-carrier-protein] S-malonyltransferase